MKQPNAREAMTRIGLEPLTSTPDSFAACVKTEIDRWAPIVKASGATAD